MTIDEAIKTIHRNVLPDTSDATEKLWLQIAEWLKELKEFKKKPEGWLWDEAENKGYNKGIDDFRDKCYERGLTVDEPLTVTDITMIWMKLKGGNNNDD